MHYHCNYSYIPHTITGDGDPVVVLVLTQLALPPGVVVRCRPIDVLSMADSWCRCQVVRRARRQGHEMYSNVHSPDDVPKILLEQIAYFSALYRDIKPGEFVKIDGWPEIAAAGTKSWKASAVMQRQRENRPSRRPMLHRCCGIV